MTLFLQFVHLESYFSFESNRQSKTKMPESKTAEEVVVIKNFINGKFLETENSFESLNPATGKPCAQIPDSGIDQVDDAVAAAKKAFKTWSLTSTKERIDIMFKIAELIERDLEDFAMQESIDQGKPLWLAKEVDIPRAVLNFRHFATTIQSDTDL